MFLLKQIKTVNLFFIRKVHSNYLKSKLFLLKYSQTTFIKSSNELMRIFILNKCLFENLLLYSQLKVEVQPKKKKQKSTQWI